MNNICKKCNNLYIELCLSCYKDDIFIETNGIFLLSDVEGCSIMNILKSAIKQNINSKIILQQLKFIFLGDIMDSTTIQPIDIKQKFITWLTQSQLHPLVSLSQPIIDNQILDYKSFNIRNLIYITKNKNCTIILGNRDIVKLKSFFIFKLDKYLLSNNIKIILNNLSVNDFNNLIIEFKNIPQFIDYFKFNNNINCDNLLNFFIFHIDSYNNDNFLYEKPMSKPIFIILKKLLKNNFIFLHSNYFYIFLTFMNYNNYPLLSINNNFDCNQLNIHNFNLIYKILIDTHGAPNLIYTLLYELETEFNLSLLNNIIILDNIIDDELNEYLCYLIGFIFNKLCSNIIKKNKKNDPYQKIRGILKKMFIKSKIVHLIDNNLLSHGGITKYCLSFYLNKKQFYNKIYNLIINNNYIFNQKFKNNNINTAEEYKFKINNFFINSKKYFNFISQNIIDKVLLNVNYDNIFQFNININLFFKKLINNIINFSDFKNALSSYIYLIISSTDCTSPILNQLFINPNTIILNKTRFQKNYPQNNFFSPIGPGFMKLSEFPDINFKFISSFKLNQIMGHKPFGISTSFFEINNYNQVLINLDTSNTFIGTIYNKNVYLNFNLLNINFNKILNITKIIDLSNFDFVHINSLTHNFNFKIKQKHTIFLNYITDNSKFIELLITYNEYNKLNNLYRMLFSFNINEYIFVYNGFATIKDTFNNLIFNNLLCITIMYIKPQKYIFNIVLLIGTFDEVLNKIKFYL